MEYGPVINHSNVSALLKQGDFIMYDGKFGVVIEDSAYTLGLRCNGRSLNNILNDCNEVYKIVSNSNAA